MTEEEPVDLLRHAEDRGAPTEQRWVQMRQWLGELPSRRCCDAGAVGFPDPCPWHPPAGDGGPS